MYNRTFHIVRLLLKLVFTSWVWVLFKKKKLLPSQNKHKKQKMNDVKVYISPAQV